MGTTVTYTCGHKDIIDAQSAALLSFSASHDYRPSSDLDGSPCAICRERPDDHDNDSIDRPVAPNAEALGREVRETWIQWAKEQPDVAEHPNWLTPWDELQERDKDVDRRIAIAVLNAYHKGR